MKKVFWINPIFYAAIILFIVAGCKKEVPEKISDVKYGLQSDSLSVTHHDSINNPALIVFNPNLNYGTVTDIDGNVYKTIQIGTQTWMAENLRTTRYADGSSIPLVTDDDNWRTLKEAGKAFCWFNNDSSNARSYGALYTWAAAMNGAVSSSSSPSGIQGVCPTGWHLPSDQEWTTLANYLGGPEAACGKLKETDTLHWRSPNSGATNESGFTALPGGHRSFDAVWWNLRDIGFWLTSTKEEEWSGWYYVHYDIDGSAINRRVHPYQNGFSVRCLKGDQVNTIVTSYATNISMDGATLNGRATLNGYVPANNLSTIVTFEYGTSTSYGQEVTAIQSPLDDSVSANVIAELTDLAPGTYHFRIKAVNSAGTFFGDDKSFSTIVGTFPESTIVSATNISTNSMTLSSTVDANTFTTTVTFEYGTTGGTTESHGDSVAAIQSPVESYGDSVAAIQSPVAANTSSIVSADISGLTPGTTYYCRIKLKCLLGPVVYYRIMVTTFTCDQAPTVTILPVTNISNTSVTLNGILNANGLPTTVTFEGAFFPNSDGPSWIIPALQSPITGNTFTNVSAVKNKRFPGFTFRVKAVNSCGTNFSEWMSFKW